MCEDGEHYLTSNDQRKGWFKPAGRAWREVEYSNVEGLAVFEGCIILGSTDALEEAKPKLDQAIKAMPRLLEEPDLRVQGVAIKGEQYRWKNRTIPYFIPADIPDRARIDNAIAHWHAKTSMRFVPRTTQPDYVVFTRITNGCASAVGRQGGAQQLVIRDSCTTGNIIHELGHTIGLWHEQSRADRGNFVDIIADNIQAGTEHNFNQHIADGIDIADYDFGSIMHYPATAFSANGSETIRPKVPLPAGVVMGQRTALSAGDIAAVEKLYQAIPAPNG
jgi:Astacin (Peptidase family M12A)